MRSPQAEARRAKRLADKAKRESDRQDALKESISGLDVEERAQERLSARLELNQQQQTDYLKDIANLTAEKVKIAETGERRSPDDYIEKQLKSKYEALKALKAQAETLKNPPKRTEEKPKTATIPAATTEKDIPKKHIEPGIEERMRNSIVGIWDKCVDWVYRGIDKVFGTHLYQIPQLAYE